MNRGLVCASLTVFVAACATTAEVDQKTVGNSKLAVVQMGILQNAEHVFCEEPGCPKRTPKYLPQPAPVQKPVAAPLPSVAKQEPFKVHFRWGWSRLDQAGRNELEKVLASGALANAKRIEVSGRTDPTGSYKYNERLALRRATTVKAALVMAGIPEGRITALAQTPCCNGDKRAAPAAMRELRRTDIDIRIK